MQKWFIAAVLSMAAMFASSCGKERQIVTIAIPNDVSNQSRALLLLQQLGYIRLKSDAELTVSLDDVDDNPCGIVFREVETQQLPARLKETDFSIIPSAVAMAAGLNPLQKAVAHGAISEYGNIIAVKAGMEEVPEVKVIVAALRSRMVADFISKEYQGGVVSVVRRPGDGYDSTVDYQALKGHRITVAALLFPHAEILNIVSNLLKKKDIELCIKVCSDDKEANEAVEKGLAVANYCQYFLSLQEFNRASDCSLVSCGEIHTEPMAIYPGRKKSLSILNQ